MTYMTDMASGIDDLYALFGVATVYTDEDSALTNVVAIVDHDVQQFGDVAPVSGSTVAISVRVSELALPPRRGETYTVGGTVYTVDSLLRSDELEHMVLTA